MNFDHGEDRRMLADALGRFVKEQYGFEVRQRIAHAPPGHSAELWRRFGELGAIGALFDEESGGLGGSGFDLMVVFEQLGRGLVTEPFLGTLLAGRLLAAGDAAQRTGLEEMIAGTRLLVLAHGERDGQEGLAQVATRARREGAGWVLDGAKAVVANAEVADAFVISARTAGADGDEAGISLFLVPAGTPGLALSGYGLIDGGRAADLSLDGLQLPADALLGPEGGGHAPLEQAIGAGLVALCAESLGAMDAAKDATLDYLRTRKQFGVPLGSFQALQHRMADLLLEVEQARSATINAAAALDAATDRRTRERALSAAKFTIGRVGTLVAEECIQLHGAIGMTWELPLAHYAKHLVMIDHQLGDEDHHLGRYIELSRGGAC